MTDDEARKLAQRLIDTWPSGPKAYIWRDVVHGLDAPKAASAYRNLVRADNAKPPTTGQFMAEYRRQIAQQTMSAAGPSWRGDEIGLDEYLTRLTHKATHGNQDAADELDNWTRWLTRKDTPAA